MLRGSFRSRLIFYAVIASFVTFVPAPIIVNAYDFSISSEWVSVPPGYKDKTYTFNTWVGSVTYKAYMWIYQLSEENDKNYDVYGIVMRLKRVSITYGVSSLETLIRVINKAYPYDISDLVPYAFAADESPEPGSYYNQGSITIEVSIYTATISWETTLYAVQVSTDQAENEHTFTQTRTSSYSSYSALGPYRDSRWLVIFKYPDASRDGNPAVNYAPVDGRMDTIFHIEGYLGNQGQVSSIYGQFTIIWYLYDLHYDGDTGGIPT
ncbi:MAG: hypothetical protein ACP6IS_01760 [Candidatus Asgardarchaeia archaeon]